MKIPERALTDKSLQVSTIQNKSYTDWTGQDHLHSCNLLQKIVAVWEKNSIAEQYLVYGKQSIESNDFNWEIVPYSKTDSIIFHFWQQFLVLWSITFGGGILHPSEREAKEAKYKEMFEKPFELLESQENKTKTVDAFCNPQVLSKQTVLEGKEIRVLYNYAPIGFGGEKLHFLVVPKKHRTKFSDLTFSEYRESMQMTKKLIKYFSKDVYLFHKTGRNAGQTVPHFHLHVIFTSNKAQDFFGKLTILRNMLFGSFPMKDQDLQQKVANLKLQLQ